jgi:hypothetical protein
MRLRCAVPKTPAKSSVPLGSPLNKLRSLLTGSESTLPQSLIPLDFISFNSNVYRKPGEGSLHHWPKVLQLVTSRLLFLRARTNPRNPNPLCALLHNSWIPGGWGISGWDSQSSWLSFLAASPGSPVTNHRPRVTVRGPRITAPLSPGTVARRPAKCQNHASCSRHRRQETYPPRLVSKAMRADIGRGKESTPSPIASRSLRVTKRSHSQEGLGPTF